MASFTPRKGVRRRHEDDDEDDEFRMHMPPNKKALVELLENLCISMSSSSSPASSPDTTNPPGASNFMAANGPRQFVYPRRSRYNLYPAYMQRMKESPTPPRDPTLGAMVLYNSAPALPSPLRRYVFPPFTIPEESECDGEYDPNMMMDVDMDGDEYYYAPRAQPRLAGNLTHSEWFLPDDAEEPCDDDDDENSMDIMDML
ncbi:Aste57867_12214 [Aphanomyces stellatus]|uniref:Aste57867_12214 protein n=1 Tax=Aphanomyces stellatus TaxID=120398 RepID=A0A485KVE7_9STRA|nr:hypothetical protein As57867_012169 [Aphanomyces stellatus]VFT89068.1 Aste57867_12214 [Aphanomyces stellatus]